METVLECRTISKYMVVDILGELSERQLSVRSWSCSPETVRSPRYIAIRLLTDKYSGQPSCLVRSGLSRLHKRGKALT